VKGEQSVRGETLLRELLVTTNRRVLSKVPAVVGICDTVREIVDFSFSSIEEKVRRTYIVVH
jgi:hypothetical protein